MNNVHARCFSLSTLLHRLSTQARIIANIIENPPTPPTVKKFVRHSTCDFTTSEIYRVQNSEALYVILSEQILGYVFLSIGRHVKKRLK